jgi:hypothetical protein
MPRKSAINRGKTKFDKLYLRILTTVKAQYPNAPEELVAKLAAEGVYKYASSLGYYEGVWRGFKGFLASAGLQTAYRNVMGPLRSAVIQIARLQMTGATDDQLRNVIESLAFDITIKQKLKDYFGVI